MVAGEDGSCCSATKTSEIGSQGCWVCEQAPLPCLRLAAFLATPLLGSRNQRSTLVLHVGRVHAVGRRVFLSQRASAHYRKRRCVSHLRIDILRNRESLSARFSANASTWSGGCSESSSMHVECRKSLPINGARGLALERPEVSGIRDDVYKVWERRWAGAPIAMEFRTTESEQDERSPVLSLCWWKPQRGADRSGTGWRSHRWLDKKRCA